MNNMKSNMVTKGVLIFLSAAFLIGLLAGGVNAGPHKKRVNSNILGVAIKGYDTVAYFTEGRAVKGQSKFSYGWNDAEWYFASAKNRDLFKANPEDFAPKYGGYCAASLATTGKVVDVNPEAFKIIDGKLYLSWSNKYIDEFAAKGGEAINKADENWAKYTQRN